MNVFQENQILLAIHLRLQEVYGVDLDKVCVRFEHFSKSTEIKVLYEYNEEIEIKTLKTKIHREHWGDLTAYYGLDPSAEIVAIFTNEIVLLLPKNMFTNFKWIAGRIRIDKWGNL